MYSAKSMVKLILFFLYNNYISSVCIFSTTFANIFSIIFWFFAILSECSVNCPYLGRSIKKELSSYYIEGSGLIFYAFTLGRWVFLRFIVFLVLILWFFLILVFLSYFYLFLAWNPLRLIWRIEL